MAALMVYHLLHHAPVKVTLVLVLFVIFEGFSSVPGIPGCNRNSV